MLRLKEESGPDLGLGAIFAQPVLSGVAALLDAAPGATTGLETVPTLAEGLDDETPLVLIHPAGGLGWGYRTLARAIAPGRRVLAFQHSGLDVAMPMPDSLDALAEIYCGLLPEGPVHLAG